MEETLNNQLQQLFQSFKIHRNSEVIGRIVQINQILDVNKTPVITQIVEEIELFLKKQKEYSLVEHFVNRKSSDLKYLCFNDNFYEISPINVFNKYDNIFKDDKFKFIKLSYLANPKISQKLIILYNLKGILSEYR
jgi:hypothetical protein